ncbi:MAG: heme biosynthesis HemY N-terminal domain-containing protein [Paracoccaceae bacterium]|nr:heme biosynthesis HemY N-terminal domain-containing protein [Paracoccaceae bacterium]
MLWSMIKIILFVTLVAAVTLGSVYLLEVDGGVQITIGGWEFTLGALQSVLAAVIVVILVWLAFKFMGLLIALLRFINGDETALSRYFDRNRERRGFHALSEGMMALASGDGREAMTKAQRAEKYLARPELTNLLLAQGAEMSGDRKKAEQVYKRLLTDEKTRFVGVHGIMKQKLAAGDSDTALKLAEKAFDLKPKHEETQDILLRLQAEKEDWTGARKTLNAKLKQGTLPRDVHKRREAVLAVSEAQAVLDDGTSMAKREAAIEANRLSPDLIPAAVMAADAQIEAGSPRKATRLILKAWSVQPHPDLAAAFARIAPDEAPADRLKRFQKMIDKQPEHAESRMLKAELLIASEDFPAARRAMGDLVENEPDSRVLTIMAAIARGEGAEDSEVRSWMARAVSAPRAPSWVCENCHNVQSNWTPVCGNCQSFDTLGWARPPTQTSTSPTGVEMMPLIVGGHEFSGPQEPVVVIDDDQLSAGEDDRDKT